MNHDHLFNNKFIQVLIIFEFLSISYNLIIFNYVFKFFYTNKEVSSGNLYFSNENQSFLLNSSLTSCKLIFFIFNGKYVNINRLLKTNHF